MTTPIYKVRDDLYVCLDEIVALIVGIDGHCRALLRGGHKLYLFRDEWSALRDAWQEYLNS